MPDAVLHPTPQELTAFGLGKLPERAAAAVAAHLESCSACRQVVAGVSADSFLDKVRAAGPAGPSFPSSLARPAIPNVPCPDVPPDLISHPKYLILRELGRGGMGVVYQARHKEMNRQVVIKVINRSLLDRPDTLERFHREVQAAALLAHPNIVTAYDAEQVGDAHMLVMEFVPGQSLAEVVQKKGPVPVTYACHFARQVALGLQHAHERNMVHRDIKPQNLMLSLKNQIKILDFGLAKVVREQVSGTGLTAHDTYLGTPDYCAPEQAQDARSADIRADLYSLGCTLYFLLSSRPPFREDSVVNTILAHMQKQPQPLPELRPNVPAELWQVVKRLLAKEPAQRYQKPIEVFRALSAFVKPGVKPEAKSGSTLPPGVVSPVKGTVIAADTGEIKKILRDVPGKTPPKKAPPTAEVSLFADRTEATGAPKEIMPVVEGVQPSPAAWWKRPGVLAGAFGVSLALIVMAVILIEAKEQKPNVNRGNVVSSNDGTDNLKLPPAEIHPPSKTSKAAIMPEKKPAEGSRMPAMPSQRSGKPQDVLTPLFTEKQLAEWRFVPDKSANVWGKDIDLREGIIVLDKPGSLLVTKKADYKNVLFTAEIAASERTKAFAGVHLQQHGKNWLGKTSWIFDNENEAKILAGQQQRNFSNRELGMKRARLDYDQFFTMRMSIRGKVMQIFVDGTLRSGVSYNGDPIHLNEGCVGIMLTEGCLKIRKLDVQMMP